MKFFFFSSVYDNPNLFFCPSGKTFISSPSRIEKDVDENCQCSCCEKYDFFRSDLGCSGGKLGDFLSNEYNGLWACKIHDLCYMTEAKTQEECDDMLWVNIMHLCNKSEADCSFAADFAWKAVDRFGSKHYWGGRDNEKEIIKCQSDCSCNFNKFKTNFHWRW